MIFKWKKLPKSYNKKMCISLDANLYKSDIKNILTSNSKYYIDAEIVYFDKKSLVRIFYYEEEKQMLFLGNKFEDINIINSSIDKAKNWCNVLLNNMIGMEFGIGRNDIERRLVNIKGE